MRMRKPTYVEGVAWIADNDSAGDDMPVEQLALLISVLLVADLFGVEPITVAADVLAHRRGLKLLNAFDCDPDFRRNPKTQLFCWRCQKDLKPEQAKRWIHLIDGGNQILHPDSEDAYKSDEADCGFVPVGMDCARKIGIAWTSEQPTEFDYHRKAAAQ